MDKTNIIYSFECIRQSIKHFEAPICTCILFNVFIPELRRSFVRLKYVICFYFIVCERARFIEVTKMTLTTQKPAADPEKVR